MIFRISASSRMRDHLVRSLHSPHALNFDFTARSLLCADTTFSSATNGGNAVSPPFRLEALFLAADASAEPASTRAMSLRTAGPTLILRVRASEPAIGVEICHHGFS